MISAFTVTRDGLMPWKVLRQMMERVRPFVDEHLVLVDERTQDETVDVATSLGARVERYRVDGPSIEYGAYQYGQSRVRHPWMLWVSDDELPSRRFLRDMPRFTQISAIHHVPMVWLFEGRALGIFDWHPVFFPREATCESRVHGGPAGFDHVNHDRLPYWHFALNAPVEDRREKVDRYADAFGGHEGRAWEWGRNARWYLPELSETPQVPLWATRRFR